MTQSMELTEKVERIRDLTALDAAEELVRLPADDIQFILARLPASQAVAIASHLGQVAATDSAASLAVLSGMEASIGELMTPVTATLPQSTTVAGTRGSGLASCPQCSPFIMNFGCLGLEEQRTEHPYIHSLAALILNEWVSGRFS